MLKIVSSLDRVRVFFKYILLLFILGPYLLSWSVSTQSWRIVISLHFLLASVVSLEHNLRSCLQEEHKNDMQGQDASVSKSRLLHTPYTPQFLIKTFGFGEYVENEIIYWFKKFAINKRHINLLLSFVCLFIFSKTLYVEVKKKSQHFLGLSPIHQSKLLV